MRCSLGEYLKRIANDLASTECPSLSQDDADKLNAKGPELIRRIQKDLSGDPEEKDLKDFSDDDKRTLLAYIVYVRENITTEMTDKPNAEDAAKILHGDVYKSSGNKSNKELDKNLIKQLQKAGIKPNKGE